MSPEFVPPYSSAGGNRTREHQRQRQRHPCGVTTPARRLRGAINRPLRTGGSGFTGWTPYQNLGARAPLSSGPSRRSGTRLQPALANASRSHKWDSTPAPSFSGRWPKKAVTPGRRPAEGGCPSASGPWAWAPRTAGRRWGDSALRAAPCRLPPEGIDGRGRPSTALAGRLRSPSGALRLDGGVEAARERLPVGRLQRTWPAGLFCVVTSEWLVCIPRDGKLKSENPA